MEDNQEARTEGKHCTGEEKLIFSSWKGGGVVIVPTLSKTSSSSVSVRMLNF